MSEVRNVLGRGEEARPLIPHTEKEEGAPPVINWLSTCIESLMWMVFSHYSQCSP